MRDCNKTCDISIIEKKVDEVKRRSFSDYTRMVLEEGLGTNFE